MKTVEEKAKSYDEARERAKKMYEQGMMPERLEYIFPELRESEDERIRKKLIGIFTNQSLCDVYNLKSEDVLAYLEKQEQKLAPDWMPKFLDELRSKKNYFDWDEHRDIEGHILAIINWIDPNYFDRKEKEQKPVDEQFEEWLNAWYQGSKELGGNVVMSEEEFKNWSRGIKNMYDKPADWSEEDEEIIANAIKQLYSYANSYHNANNDTREKEVRKVADKLKSLRPQPKQGKKGLILTKEQEK